MEKKVVLAITMRNNEVLIVRRKEKEGMLLWQFPGGEVEENETEEIAIIRELKEETGLNCEILKCLGERVHPHTKRNMSYWACSYVSGHIYISDKDLAEAIWVTIEELEKYFTTDLYEPVTQFLNKYNC